MLLNPHILGKYSKIALGISGGPDSLAMLYLLHEKGIKFTALTIDHNLRKESEEEAKYVSSLCKDLGIEHHILKWNHDGVTSNIHDKARKARYQLMTDFCSKNNIEALATAHHRDDRIENFFIRIHQGAGLFGLIDKDHIIYNGINIIRPLFDAKKSELIEYLNKNNIKYFEDPSNEDPKYLRSNIRKWISTMPKELEPELFKKRIISVKHNLERASELVNRIFKEDLDSNTFFSEAGFTGIGDLNSDREIAYLFLSKVLSITGNSDELIRLKSLENLYNRMVEGIEKNTLAGCIIKWHPFYYSDKSYMNGWIIYREFGKNPPKDTPLQDGAIWDNRYKIHTKKTYKNLRISFLNRKEYSEIKKDIEFPNSLKEHLQKNKEIIFTLPVVKNLEKVIAIPHINYYDDAYSNLQNDIKFEFIRKNQ